MAAGRACFRPRARLSTTASYQRVFAQSTRSADRFFTILARPGGRPYARLGLAISKKRLPRAVARNRVKRLIRESFRLHARDLPAIDLVVLAGRELARADNRTLYHSLARHWRRLATVSTSHADISDTPAQTL